MSATILNFTPQFVREAAKALGLFADDLSVYERRTHTSGKPVFGLAYDMGNRMFPEWVFSDMPLWSKRGSIRVSLEKAVEAKRFLESNGVTIVIAQPGTWDQETEEYSNGRRSVTQTIRYLADLGELFPVDASFHMRIFARFLRQDEDPGEANVEVLTRNAGLYAQALRRAFKKLGLGISIMTPEISSASEWEEVWANIWEQVNTQLVSS